MVTFAFKRDHSGCGVEKRLEEEWGSLTVARGRRGAGVWRAPDAMSGAEPDGQGPCVACSSARSPAFLSAP